MAMQSLKQTLSNFYNDKLFPCASAVRGKCGQAATYVSESPLGTKCGEIYTAVSKSVVGRGCSLAYNAVSGKIGELDSCLASKISSKFDYSKVRNAVLISVALILSALVLFLCV